MCQAYRRQHDFDAVSVLPTNLYGPNDNFDERKSHVIPGLIRRMHDAKSRRAQSFEVWGTGTPRREFLHADDFASAVVTVLEKYSAEEPINIGAGSDISIAEVAGAGARHGRARSATDFRRLQARWHAAQAARRVAYTRTGLGAGNSARRGNRSDLSCLRRAAFLDFSSAAGAFLSACRDSRFLARTHRPDRSRHGAERRSIYEVQQCDRTRLMRCLELRVTERAARCVRGYFEYGDRFLD